MEPEPTAKRRKIHKPPPRRTVPSHASKNPSHTPAVAKLMDPGAPISGISIGIQQAKDTAVAQAQQGGCTANFKIFDSQYGNFLVPVVPSRTELTG